MIGDRFAVLLKDNDVAGSYISLSIKYSAYYDYVRALDIVSTRVGATT